MGASRFVNGGRVFFEANIFGYHTSSFTTKGFFDKEGYVEPMLKDSGVRWFLNNWVDRVEVKAAIALASLCLLFVQCCSCSARKPKLHIE